MKGLVVVFGDHGVFVCVSVCVLDISVYNLAYVNSEMHEYVFIYVFVWRV